MSYTPTEWKTGDVITAERLNKAEQGIKDAHDNAADISSEISTEVASWLDEHVNVTEGVNIDDTLSVAGSAADAKATGDKLVDLKSSIQSISGNTVYNEWENGLYRLNVETVTLTPEANNNYKCQKISCSAGDEFTVTGGSYGSAARLWGFVASDGTRLDVEANSVTVTNKIITAPTGTAFLLVNWYIVGENVVSIESGVFIVDRVDALENEVAEVSADADEALGSTKASAITTTINNASDENYSTNALYVFKARKPFALLTYKFNDAASGTVSITILRYNRSTGKYTIGSAYSGAVGETIAIGEYFNTYDAILYKISGNYFYGSTTPNQFFSVNYGWNANLNQAVDSTVGYNLCGEFVVAESDAISGVNPCRYYGRECSVFDNILCIGDSITQGAPTPPSITPDPSKATRTVTNQTMYSYPASIGKQYGVNCTNWGRSGITSQSWYDYYSVNEPSWSGHDAAVILLGNNDYHLVDDLGGLTEETLPIASARSKAAMMSIITKLKADNADIKIFICTLLPGWARATTLSPLVCDNIRDIAHTEENVFLIDLASYSLLIGESAYMNNHPTAIGYNRLAQEIGGAIGYTVINNLDRFKWIQFIGTEYAMDGQ